VPFDWISVTPAVRPFSTSCIAVMGCCCTSFAVSIFAIELPSSRVSWFPVAVVTTASSWNAALASAKSCVVSCVALTVTLCWPA
jgi:hypothetical protein